MNIPRIRGFAVQEHDMTIERVTEPSVSSSSKFIRQFAAELDVQERHCVILHYLHGLSVSEIAEVLTCSDRLVESLLQGVKSRLRESAWSANEEGSSARERMTPSFMV